MHLWLDQFHLVRDDPLPDGMLKSVEMLGVGHGHEANNHYS